MKRLIYILALGAFGIITTEFGVIGILPDLVKQFHITVDTAGWLLSAFALTVALTGPFMNLLMSKINRKTVLCVVLAVFVLSNLISAIAPNFTILILARILPAFLHPVFWAVAITTAAKQAGPKDAPKAIATVMAGLSVATVVGVPLTTYMADLFDWHASFILSAVINMIALTALGIFAPSMPVAIAQGNAKSQLNLLRSANLWTKLISTTLILAGMFATYGYLAEYLNKIAHMTGAQISLLLLVFGSTGIAGNWMMGRALSVNVKLTLRSFLIALVIVHLLAYRFGGHFIPMVLILSAWGFIHTGGFLASNVYLNHGEPESSLDFINSLMPSFFNAGVTLGTLAGGLVIAHYGVHNVIWISVPLLLVPLLLTFVGSGNKVSSESVDVAGLCH